MYFTWRHFSVNCVSVESLRAAVEVKTNGDVSTEELLPLESLSQKWKDFESKSVELLCHFDFFEKAFEAQQTTTASASTMAELEKLLEENKVCGWLLSPCQFLRKLFLQMQRNSGSWLFSCDLWVTGSNLSLVIILLGHDLEPVSCTLLDNSVYLENFSLSGLCTVEP